MLIELKPSEIRDLIASLNVAADVLGGPDEDDHRIVERLLKLQGRLKDALPL